MMNKIAAAELDSLLMKSAATIRSQASEIAQLRSELAGHHRAQHAEKIASIAVTRGLMSDDDAQEYAKGLAESGKDLDMVEDFVSRNNGVGVSLGVAEDLHKTASENVMSGSASAADQRFVNFLLNSDLV